MDKLGEELDILLNEYVNLKIPKEVGSHDLTEDSEILTMEEINPEDSISNSGEEIYNIEGQIRILNGNVKEIKLNPKSEIKGHYIQIYAELNNIQCNYCNQKPYANNSRGITHFKKHLIAKHNI